jgi:hypothetical protein
MAGLPGYGLADSRVKENQMPELSVDLLGMVFAAFLTIMVLSYMIGDNVLFRVATYLFVGVASGYAGSVAYQNVIRPALIDPILQDGPLSIFRPEAIPVFLIPWFLSVLLLLKISPRLARYGSFPIALLVGVGAAVIVGGGITGTLIPQSIAAAEGLDPQIAFPAAGEELFIWLERLFGALILLLATISTLFYFRFAARREITGQARRSRIASILAYIGQIFIAVTFGVMYAGTITASMLILTQRFQFLREVLQAILGGA